MKGDFQRIQCHRGTGVFAFVERRPACILLAGMLLFLSPGCGGSSEDFSKPPAAIANKKPAEPESPPKKDVSAIAPESNGSASGTDSTTAQKAPIDSSAAAPPRAADAGQPGTSKDDQQNKQQASDQNSMSGKESTPATQAAITPADTNSKAAADNGKKNDKGDSGDSDLSAEMKGTDGSEGDGATGLFGLADAGDSGTAKKPESGPVTTGTMDPLARPAFAADVSQDGELLFVEAPGGRVAVFETASRKLLGNWTAAENDILQIVYDDVTRRVAAVLPSGKIQLWQYYTVEGLDRYSRELLWNQPQMAILDGHAGATNDLAFSPSRSELASVGDDGALRIWNTEMEASVVPFEDAVLPDLSYVSSETGDHIVGFSSGHIVIWEVAGRKIVRRLSKFDSPLACLNLTGPGLNAVIGAKDGSVIQMDLLHDDTPVRTSVFSEPVIAARTSFDRRQLTAVSAAGEVRRWNVDQPQSVVLEKAGLQPPLTVSPDSRFVAAGVKGGVRIRSLTNSDEGPTWEVSSAADSTTATKFLADGRLATATVSGWAVSSESLVQFSGSTGSPILCVDSPDNQALVTADEAGHVVRWRVSPGRTAKVELDGKLTAVSATPASGQIVLASETGTLALYDLNRTTIIERFQVPNETIRSIVMPDRERLFVGTSAGRVLRVLRDGDPIVLGELGATIRDLRISADKQLLFVLSEAGQAGAFQVASDATSGVMLMPLEDSSGMTANANSDAPMASDGPRTFADVSAILAVPGGMISGHKGGQIRLWDVSTGKVSTLLKHDQPIACVSSAGNSELEFIDADGQVFAVKRDTEDLRPVRRGTLENIRRSWGTGIQPSGTASKGSQLLYSTEKALITATSFGDEPIVCLERLESGEEILCAGVHGNSGAFTVAPSGMVRLWTVAPPKILLKHPKPLTSLHCPGDNRLIGVAQGSLVQLSGTPALPVLRNITKSSCSADRRTVTLLEGTSRAVVMDATSMKVIADTTVPDGCRRVQADSTGRFLMLQTDERTLSVRELKTGSIVHRYNADADLADVQMLQPDQIVAVLSDGSLRTFRPAEQNTVLAGNNNRKPVGLLPNADAVVCLQGLELTVASFDGALLWKCPGSVAEHRRVAMSHQGEWVGALALIDGKTSLVLWNSVQKTESRIEVPQDCDQLLFGCSGKTVSVLAGTDCVTWALSDRKQLSTAKADAQAVVCVTDDATVLASRGSGQLVRTVSRRLANVQAIDSGAMSVAYSDTGDVIAVGGTDGLVHFRKRSSLAEESGTLTAGSTVRQLIYSGRIVIARSDQPFLHCWVLADAETPQAATPSEIQQPGQVTYMELDARQEFLVTVNPPSNVSVWYMNLVPGPPRQVMTLEGRTSPVVAGTILPEERRLIVVDADASLSINTMADVTELRRSTFKALTQSMDSTELAEIPKSSEGRDRKGNDLLTQQLELQNRVRQAQLEKRSRARLPFSRSPSALLGADQMLESIERARASQLLASVEAASGQNTANLIFPGTLALPAKPFVAGSSGSENRELADAYQKMNELRPAYLSSVASTSNELPTPAVTETAAAEAVSSAIKGYVDSQWNFVRKLQKTSVEAAAGSIRGSGKSGDFRDLLNRRLEQIYDDRSIQTISTDFRIPENFSAASLVRLKITRDGNTIVSSYPPVSVSDEEKYPGRIDVWDLVSGVSLKQFETVGAVNGFLINDSENRILTVPEVVRYDLFDPVPSVRLFDAVFEVSSERSKNSLAGLARRTTDAAQGEILQLFDRETLEPLKLPMPESFDAETTAMAFGHETRLLAFAVREQKKNHKLFVCSPEDLSGFESIVPIDQFQSQSDASGGFLALTFSPDDGQLAVLVEDPQKDNELLLRILEQKNGRWALKSSTPLKGILQAGSSRENRIQLRFTGLKNRVAILTASACLVGDLGERKSRNAGLWKIPFAGHDDSSALSDDGRWLAKGTSAGHIGIFDLCSAYPDVGVAWPRSGDAAHDGPVAAISFSSAPAGLSAPVYLSSFGLENRIKVWSLLELETAVKEQHLQHRKLVR